MKFLISTKIKNIYAIYAHYFVNPKNKNLRYNFA